MSAFYGKIPVKIPSEVKDKLPGSPAIFRELQSLIKDWNSTGVADTEKERLMKDKLILGECDNINLKSEKLIRAFLCIELTEHNAKDSDLFQRKIIFKDVIPNKGVNSVYRCKGYSGIHIDYLFDIIDTPHSIFDLIVDMHKKTEDYNIGIKTKTYIVVEQLSHGIFNAIPRGNEDDLYELPIEKIIEKGECDQIEFKSSLRYNYYTKTADKDLELQIAKTISAFMNTDGGVLLIGLDDERKILGLENDFQTLKKSNSDGFELLLATIIKNYLGNTYLPNIKTSFSKFKEGIICRIDIRKSRNPAYIEVGSRKDFYIRTGNSLTALDIDEALDYISHHWSK